MTTPNLSHHYAQMTASERLGLIFAAGERGDETEQAKLINSGKRITRTMPDHALLALAYFELAQLMFMDLVEIAAQYQESLHRMWRLDNGNPKCRACEKPKRKSKSSPGSSEQEEPTRKIKDEDYDFRVMDLALADGCMLREKANGWKLFCERKGFSADYEWQKLPGYSRLQGLLKTAETVAFAPKGYGRWLNRIRPEGAPKLRKVPLTADGIARELDAIYQGMLTKWEAE